MDEEKVAVTSQDVTTDELSKSWDAVLSDTDADVSEPEVKEDVQVEEAAPEEPEIAPSQIEAVEQVEDSKEDKLTQQESSHLGRKVKGLNSRFDQLMARLDQIESSAKSSGSAIDVPEIISTPEDIDRYMAAKEQKARIAQAEYEKNYIRQIAELSKGSDELHDEVFDEMMNNFNKRYSDNAMADARVNYAEAKASLLTKKYAGASKVPARTTATKPPVAPAATATRTVEKANVLPKLDAETMEYVAYLRRKGMSDSDISKQL